MLQQTIIKVVAGVYENFIKQVPDVRSLAILDEDKMRSLVRGLGYYRRFGNLLRAARELRDRDYQWPVDFEGWKTLPGVGDYTAAAVSSIAFGYPVAVVDGNVERLLCRVFDLRVPTNENGLKKLFQGWLNENLDVKFPGDFNQGLMELGQRVCTQSDPKCSVCPLKTDCRSYRNRSQHLAPAPKAKKKPIDVSLRLVVLEKRGKIALTCRSEAAKFLKSTDGFLTFLKDSRTYKCDSSERVNLDWREAERIGSYRHSITKHRISVDVFRKEYAGEVEVTKWMKKSELDEALVANLDRKALKFL